MKERSVWIGFDPREGAAFAVTRHSLERHLTQRIPIHGIVLSDLQRAGLYTRPIEWKRAAAERPIMWDVISDAPMSTQHANARFLVPHLAKRGWALFCDGDMLFRSNVARLFDYLDDSKAVYCVKHKYEPTNKKKMDGQLQQQYARKNWSSLIIFNCDHSANDALTVEMVNTLPGRDLHALCWLEDDLIGELGPEWNYIVNHNNSGIDPRCVHFSEGVPDMIGYEKVPFSDEWRDELARWASGFN
jgi:lipopolysaccharide biosynthesis glycosyltransferase